MNNFCQIPLRVNWSKVTFYMDVWLDWTGLTSRPTDQLSCSITQQFNISSTKAHYLLVLGQFNPPHILQPLSQRFSLIIFSHLLHGLTSGSFLTGFPTQNSVFIYCFHHMNYVSSPFYIQVSCMNELMISICRKEHVYLIKNNTKK